jgi:multicomponent Na+:H+ antiporter subunit G
VIGEVFALVGAVLTLLAAIGVVRFPDALTRLHALTKASTLGLTLVAVGSAFVLPTANDVTSALLAAALYVMTLPIAGSMIARATYLTDEARTEIHAVDELAERRHHDATVDYE